MMARTLCALARPVAHASRLALLVAAASLVAGCTLSRPAPLKNQFLLEPPTPPAAARTHPATLRVGTFNVAAPFRGRGLVYRDSALLYATDYYREFLVAPAAMVGEATALSLARAGVFASVVPPGATPDGDYVLDGFVDALYGDMRDAARPMAEIGVTFYLTRTHGGAVTPLWSKGYQRRIPIRADVPEGHAGALSMALGEILAELARDLAAANLPPK